MRIAVIDDVHGNLPALRAVLADVDREAVDAIVVGGDVVAGPFVAECIELLRRRPEPVHWVSGNSEREALAVFDGTPPSDDAPGRAAAWSAAALDATLRDEIASWPIALTVDGICFCHGTPRSDEEMLTRGSAQAVFTDALADVTAALVVGGHTHQQFVRRVRDDLVFANAGSVGLPYEGRWAAFWMLVAGGEPEMRATDYDRDGAIAELHASGYPDVDTFLTGPLLEPIDPDWVTGFFEHRAGRGADPGPPRPASP
jgi:putative phosphoesterase